MKFSYLLSILSLVVIMASCAPQPPATPAILPTKAQQAANETVSPATVNSNELRATDPATFSLASGQVQLVEFFGFT